jgi:phosphoserine phosphatase
MEYSGRAIAVNPDRFLEKEAKKHGWEILRFRETLRNNVPLLNCG